MAKPKIDLEHPVVAAALEIYKRLATQAYELAAEKDSAVRPVFALNERTQSVRHIGSCVLLKVRDEIFALSASHVFDDVGKYQLLIGCGNRLHSLAGDRFSSKRGPSGTHRDDPIDASVFHITANVTEEIDSSALTLQDLDLLPADRRSELYIATGYRVSQSKSTPKGHTTKLDRYPSMELDDKHYDHLSCSRDRHLVIAFEEKVLVNGTWQKSPSIQGFSGGAMFRIPELSLMTSVTKTEFDKVKLAAILIERRKGEGSRFQSAAVGTRLNVHFGLIHNYLPELKFEEMLVAEYERQTVTLSEI